MFFITEKLWQNDISSCIKRLFGTAYNGKVAHAPSKLYSAEKYVLFFHVCSTPRKYLPYLKEPFICWFKVTGTLFVRWYLQESRGFMVFWGRCSKFFLCIVIWKNCQKFQPGFNFCIIFATYGCGMNWNKHTRYVQFVFFFLIKFWKYLRELSIQFSLRVKEIKILFKGVKGAFESAT